jgi:drug/metabolite transporter (DMT)-like permease
VFENPLSEVEQVREVWLYILLGGVCAMGVAKLLFLQSIKRASVPKVSSIILTYPAFTMLYALVLIGEQITVWSLSGLCFTLAGVWLVVRFKTERLLAKSS